MDLNSLNTQDQESAIIPQNNTPPTPTVLLSPQRIKNEENTDKEPEQYVSQPGRGFRQIYSIQNKDDENDYAQYERYVLNSKNFSQFHSNSNFKKYLTEPFIIPSRSSSSRGQTENMQDQSIDQEVLIGSKKLIDGADPDFDRIIGSENTS